MCDLLQTRHAIECSVCILSQDSDHVIVYGKDIRIRLSEQCLIIDQLILFEVLVNNTIRAIDADQDIGRSILQGISFFHRRDAQLLQRFVRPIHRILVDGIFRNEHCGIRQIRLTVAIDHFMRCRIDLVLGLLTGCLNDDWQVEHGYAHGRRKDAK